MRLKDLLSLNEEGEVGSSGASVATGVQPVNDEPPSGSAYMENDNDLSFKLGKLRNGRYELRISSDDIKLLKRIKFHLEFHNGVPD